jgi:hypothetical protein
MWSMSGVLVGLMFGKNSCFASQNFVWFLWKLSGLSCKTSSFSKLLDGSVEEGTTDYLVEQVPTIRGGKEVEGTVS